MSFTVDNNVRVTLSASIGTGATSITVTKAVAPNRDPPEPGVGFPGILTLVDRVQSPTKIEIVQYTGRTDDGATWTLTGVSRGTENTSAQSWASGDIAFQSITSAVMGGKANSTHTHASSAITDFAEAVDDRVATLLKQGQNITLSYNDATGELTISATGGGVPDYLLQDRGIQ